MKEKKEKHKEKKREKINNTKMQFSEKIKTIYIPPGRIIKKITKIYDLLSRG